MKKYLSLFFLILKIIICIKYEYETIEEIIPKSSSLYFKEKSYKIYEYIPSENIGAEKNKTKSIYIKLYASSIVGIFIYDEYSKIKQDSIGNFINYKEYIILSDDVEKFDDFIINKNYYFVLYYNKFNNNPIDYRFLILNEINDIIQLNPSLSKEYNFFQISENPMKFIYKYEEDKIVLIRLIGKLKLKFFENNILIYNHDIKEEYKVLNKIFRKDLEYNIIFEDYSNSTYNRATINIQFFDEYDFIKPDLKQNSLLLYNMYEYFIEVDISDYKLEENIIFLLFSYWGSLTIKYQYKNKFKYNNLISLGILGSNDYRINYFRIKKEYEDNKLIIYLKLDSIFDRYYNSIIQLNNKVEEISSDENLLINETKILYIDYFKFNQYNSFGIYSNQTFLYIEQMINDESKITYIEEENIIIVKEELLKIYQKRNALIFFNEKINFTFPIKLEFKKFYYPIIYKTYSESKENSNKVNQYLQFSQDNKNEYYFYVNYRNFIDVFLPIFGNYKTYFIKTEDIKTISDFDFDRKNESDNYIIGQYSGYLKIRSNNEPSMFQHFVLNKKDNYENKRELDTGKKYYFLIKNLIKNKQYITIKSNYVNKNISLKFRAIGLNQNESITLIFDEKYYMIKNLSLEIEYEYKKYNPNLIYFSDVNINEIIYIEIKVGYLKEDLNLYKQIDFENSIGKLNYNQYNGTIIKILKDFQDDLLNYSLISKEKNLDIQITYDKLEFAVPMKDYGPGEMYPFTELLKSNPSPKVLNEKNKFFFITIYGGNEVIIKKPKIYEGKLELNKINVIPKLTDENNNYYYKIKVPKVDYHYITIQTININNYNFISINNSFHRELKIYFFETFYNSFNDNNSLFINYFDSDINNYINFVPHKEYDFNLINISNNNMIIYYNIEQIEITNKIRINATSLSYLYYPFKFKYYVFINIDFLNYTVFQFISDDVKPDKSKKQKIIIFDDEGTNKNIIYEAELGDEINTGIIYNSYYIIPVNKENNLIVYNMYYYKNFHFLYIEKSYIPYYVAGSIIILMIIFAIIILIIYKRKKNNTNLERLNETGINDIQ